MSDINSFLYQQFFNKNFPSLTSREFLTKVMGGKKGCREFIKGWLQFKKELADYKYLAIE